jgi:protein ImuA
MVAPAVAQEAVYALRRKIARIEGALPGKPATPEGAHPQQADFIFRHDGVAVSENRFLRTGAADFDAALGGGLPKAALTEIHGIQTRDAGAVTGFALALAGRMLKEQTGPALPLLWIGATEIFQEAGFPYVPGLACRFGIEAEHLLIAEAAKVSDVLWIAGEAAGMKALSAILLEVRGSSRNLDLTATRRLHRRAQAAGRPVFLLRQASEAESTAAPVRLVVSPAPAASRRTMAGPLDGTIGPPRFTVRIDKSRLAPPGQFTLEWNADECTFEDRRPGSSWTADPGIVVSASAHGADIASASGAVVAFKAAGSSAAAGHQPSREQHAAHRRPRRTG